MAQDIKLDNFAAYKEWAAAEAAAPDADRTGARYTIFDEGLKLLATLGARRDADTLALAEELEAQTYRQDRLPVAIDRLKITIDAFYNAWLANAESDTASFARYLQTDSFRRPAGGIPTTITERLAQPTA